MALATQCPHCHTTFRVAHDQLKLRAGLVRCGACKQIFNGIENLLRPDELESADKPTQAAPPEPPSPQPVFRSSAPPVPDSADVVTRPVAPEIKMPDREPEPQSPEPESPPTEQESPSPTETEFSVPAEDIAQRPSTLKPDDPLLRMTLLEVATERYSAAQRGVPLTAESAEASDRLEQTIEDLQSKPWRTKEEAEAEAETEGDALDRAEAADYEEPAFVRQARRRQSIGRALRIIMGTGSVLLFFGLLAQCAYIFRDEIAARFPETRPTLVEACSYLDCQVGLPAQIESVSIESSELQTVSTNANTFSLTVLLRNQGATEQAWPHIELTLNDANEKPIARRVFAPREYLPPPPDLSRGLAPDSEQPIKIFFELSQLKASGYRVYLFYP
ncbi:hypothetical protein GCM10027343_07360 [Noviherbaspirillum agri]